jgi:hypothetical protein
LYEAAIDGLPVFSTHLHARDGVDLVAYDEMW